MQNTPFRTTLGAPGKERIRRIHFVGIGGVGMSGIAEVLLNEGYEISGSDANISAATERLQSKGAIIFQEHLAENIEKADAIVVSTAIQQKNNPEVQAALEKRIPIIRRAEMLAELMRFRYGIAISGTHGKTTTTSLLSSILAEGDLDPTFVIGGKLNSAGCNARLGKSRYLVTEADESDASFLHLLPMMSVVTNIDVDHMETYQGDVKKLHRTFISFLHRLPFYGLAIVCIDDPGIQKVLPEVARPLLTYGLGDDADVRAIDIRFDGVKSHFIVQRKGVKDLPVELNLPGNHNVLNALAAICVATELGVGGAVIQQALKDFGGVDRRFQLLGDLPIAEGKATVVDDYGHHPRELMATIKAARSAWPGRRVVMVFQPHRFTRTRDLFDDFCQVLNDVDFLMLLEVYPAGEEPIHHADARTLCHSIRQRGKLNPVLILDKEKLKLELQRIALAQDVIIMSGAGDISSLARRVMEY